MIVVLVTVLTVLDLAVCGRLPYVRLTAISNQTVSHSLLTVPSCQLTVESSKIVSRGINSTIRVIVGQTYTHTDIAAFLLTEEGNHSMVLDPTYARQFTKEILIQTLGRKWFNVCVSDCGCKAVTIFSIPGPLTLLPPLLTVLLAVSTRQVLLSLTFGIYSASFIACAYNPIDAFIDTFNSYLILPFLDSGKAGVIVFVALMSGLIEIIEKAGGANGLANEIFKLAKTSHHASIVSTIIPCLFFFDDFAGIMIAGKSIGPLVSELGLSVQKFSFIIHMMSVSMTSICPLSSWAGVQIGYIESAFKLAGTEVSGFSFMLQSIPYRFFALSAMMSVIIYVSINNDIPPTIAYEEDMQKLKKGRVQLKSADRNDQSSVVPGRWFNAVIPILVLVVVSVVRMYYDGKAVIESSDLDIPATFANCISKCNSINSLIIGSGVSLLLMLVLVPAQRILSLSKCLVYFVDGVKGTSEPIMILILAWALGIAMSDIHTSDYIALALGDNMPVEYFPAVVCVIGYIMSYASGSAMGTQGILLPLIIPVVVHLTNDQTVYIKTVAAALGSSVFGNLCSPIADTTIGSVLFTGCPMVDHLKVMSTFCLPLALLSIIFGDLLVGLHAYPFYVAYIITAVFVFIVFAIFGRSPKRRSLYRVLLSAGRGQGASRDHNSGSTSSEDSETTQLLPKILP